MELHQMIHGFRIERIRTSEELKGTLYEMRHLKTGAELAYLDNHEDNKLFSVAFKTLPWDDTGVFHILEHSVLAGSDNYPVKEPFLDLLKSSMNTFLNAMTFPDKTMYPVSSRNEQDFINLTRVYLDAVFRPAIYHNESIFRQEGWHYEFGEDGKPFYNGVVFNEMKGALGSADGQLELISKRALYPDSVYGFESGGDPSAVPDLTYADFLRAHREFYAPSNAKIYLDGAVPLDRVLRIIDGEYLGTMDFEDKPHEIALQKPIDAQELTAYYEIGKEESEEQKTHLLYGKVFATWEERKRILAYTLTASYLAGSNEAPLKRAILEKGLAQNVEFSVVDGIAQPFYTLVFRNTDPDKKDEIGKVFREVLETLLADGIDRDELTAHFNQTEFALRDTEEPAGLIRNINALNAWLYGGDMLLYMENNALLQELRAAIDTDYYEQILRELLDGAGQLTLTLLPSKTKGDEDRTAEEQRVNAEYAAFSEQEQADVRAVYERMRLWQDTPDSPEAAATLPVLSLSDVKPEPMWTPTQTRNENGVTALFHPLPANGIVHGSLYFDISDCDDDALQTLSVMTCLLGVLPTAAHTSAQLQKEIKKTIGALDFNIEVIPDRENAQQCRVYLAVSFSVLEKNTDAAVQLITEILTATDYTNRDIIRENLLQSYEELYQGMIAAGHSFANKRALSRSSAMSAVQELTTGYSFLCYLKAFNEQFETNISPFITRAQALCREIFVTSRLTLSETAEAPHEALGSFCTQLPTGSAAAGICHRDALPPVKEAILIPAGVSYASYGANIRQYGFESDGRLRVTSLLLTYGYLWNEIRVHGGAYGCGFRPGISHNVTFHSYRDPHPLQSIEVYRSTSDFIREFVNSEETVDRYIISSIAATEALMSIAKQGYLADVYYLSDYTYTDKLCNRTQSLTLKKEELLALCNLFERMKDGNSVCIVGNADALSTLGEDWSVYRL